MPPAPTVCKDEPMSEQQAEQVDPVIVDAVMHVRDRFGSTGLSDLIALAREELATAEAALRELDDLG